MCTSTTPIPAICAPASGALPCALPCGVNISHVGSQVVVLPPYQKKGLAARMIQSVYNVYLPNKLVRPGLMMHVCPHIGKVVDVCVEDPSDNFARLVTRWRVLVSSPWHGRVRDFVDVRNVLAVYPAATFEV